MYYLSTNPYNPRHHFRYVDDKLAVFVNNRGVDSFPTEINSLHPALQITVEHENDGSLALLVVEVIKSETGYAHTRVYRKPTWSSRFLQFLNFAPIKFKRNLVRTLFDRAYRNFWTRENVSLSQRSLK